MVSGRMISADEANNIALVDYSVEPDALMTWALEIAKSFDGNPVSVMRMTKQLLTENAVEQDWSRL